MIINDMEDGFDMNQEDKIIHALLKEVIDKAEYLELEGLVPKFSTYSLLNFPDLSFLGLCGFLAIG